MLNMHLSLATEGLRFVEQDEHTELVELDLDWSYTAQPSIFRIHLSFKSDSCHFVSQAAQ